MSTSGALSARSSQIADQANGAAALAIGVWRWNETGWDRQRNNTQYTLLASAARTAAVDSPDQTNYNGRGVQVFLDVSAASGTGGLQLFVKTRAPGFPLENIALNTAPAAVIATGLYLYELYPGASGAGVTQSIGHALPRLWYVHVAVGDASAYTYSVTAQVVL